MQWYISGEYECSLDDDPKLTLVLPYLPGYPSSYQPEFSNTVMELPNQTQKPKALAYLLVGHTFEISLWRWRVSDFALAFFLEYWKINCINLKMSYVWGTWTVARGYLCLIQLQWIFVLGDKVSQVPNQAHFTW